jgi:hypothetical protein
VGCCLRIAEDNRPLAAGLYFNKNLSRHGKGAAALLRFGDKVRIYMRGNYACMGAAVLGVSWVEWSMHTDAVSSTQEALIVQQSACTRQQHT